VIAAVVGGYAIGSLPLGYLAGRRWGGVDLRAVGSRNVGATNMYRVSGPRLGLLVMALDLVKGAAAVTLASAWWTTTAQDPVMAGVAAVAGHVYPVWLRGRGGKGVATACGAFAVLTPLATLAAAVVFVLAVWATRLVSVGSLAASVTLPSMAAASGAAPAIVWGSAAAGALIAWRHRSNVLRLWRGTERRIASGAVPRA
jgi:glycerol-3-phosphate acyltransferase PlsY